MWIRSNKKFFRLKNSNNGHEDLQPAASERHSNKNCDTHCQLCYWSLLALIQARNGPRRLEYSRLLDPALNSPQSTSPTVLSQSLPECCKNTHRFIGQSKITWFDLIAPSLQHTWTQLHWTFSPLVRITFVFLLSKFTSHSRVTAVVICACYKYKYGNCNSWKFGPAL